MLRPRQASEAAYAREPSRSCVKIVCRRTGTKNVYKKSCKYRAEREPQTACLLLCVNAHCIIVCQLSTACISLAREKGASTEPPEPPLRAWVGRKATPSRYLCESCNIFYALIASMDSSHLCLVK